MCDFERGPPNSVLIVAVLEQKLLLYTVNTKLGILSSVGKRKKVPNFPKKMRLVVLVQCLALAKVVLHERAVSRTTKTHKTWLKLLLSKRFAFVCPIESHLDRLIHQNHKHH